MDLRDELAVRRTILANQRTFLTFLNVALAFFVAGVTLIRFFAGTWIFFAGWAFLPLGAVFLIAGCVNYTFQKKKIENSGSGSQGDTFDGKTEPGPV
jgi:putative membrane protein